MLLANDGALAAIIFKIPDNCHSLARSASRFLSIGLSGLAPSN